MEGMVAKRLGTPYVPGARSEDWRKIINWSYHDVIVSKVTHSPLTVQLQSMEGDYFGSVVIGFTEVMRQLLKSLTPPFPVRVKSRGCKLRLPQIVDI